ncbi:rab-like protein 2B isoform X2 [Rousettus aegyptiacus]|uniref:rab-like protein 2B isoform X2 n=1 Tax=Rousettus aegyptiacus TaxID=9407 RepID=UPI00168D407F|nr:rab-like protein 2B isoform X2 [Rousettus aegyptiacus]
MAEDRAKPCELDQEKYDADDNVKIICLGDSAVGKSKLMERFLMDGFVPQQLSTYALTLYKHTATVDGRTVLVDFWDTAGQERFQSMHASYYHKAHACIMPAPPHPSKQGEGGTRSQNWGRGAWREADSRSFVTGLLHKKALLGARDDVGSWNWAWTAPRRSLPHGPPAGRGSRSCFSHRAGP